MTKSFLTLIKVGFLGVFFAVGGKITPYLKLIRNLERKYTHICSFRKFTLQYQDFLNFTDVSSFFCKNSAFFGKNSTFALSSSMKTMLEIF